jgi:hypothetical protein
MFMVFSWIAINSTFFEDQPIRRLAIRQYESRIIDNAAAPVFAICERMNPGASGNGPPSNK